MKKRLKIKQLLLGIGLSILGLLAFNNNEINAQFNVIGANPGVQTGEYVYKVLDNYYYSNNANNYVFNEESKTWTQHSWSGLPSSIYGNYFWTDGETYYYGGSSTSQQYYYNPDTNAWINYSSSVASYGNYIWTDGNYTYFSNSSTQKYWNKANKTWMNMSWGGLTSFTGNNVWKDGNNIYYSSGSTQYKLNTSTSTWSQIGYNTPSTMRNLNGQDVWTDGTNTYYSGTSPTSSSATYNFIFDGVDTWTEINLGGFDRFEGRNVYNIGNDTYFTYYFATYGWNMSSGYSQEDLDNAYNEGYNAGISSTEGYQNGYEAGIIAGRQEGYQNGYDTGYQEGYDEGYVTNNTIPNIYIQSSNFIYNTGYFPLQISITDYINNLNGKLDFTALYNYDFSGAPNQNMIGELVLNTEIPVSDTLKFDLVNNDTLSNNLWIILGNTNNSCNNNDYGINCVYLTYSDLVSNNYMITASTLYPNLNITEFNYIQLSFNYNNNMMYGVKSITDITMTSTADSEYDIGYNVGYIVGKNEGMLLGRTESYNLGYEAGLDYQFTNENTITGMMGTLFTMPINMFKTIFDFEFLGVNLAGFFLSLVTLLVVIWLIKKFI